MSQAISGVIVGGGNIYSSPTTQLDDELSSTSINAVQNKAISDALDEKASLIDNNTFSGNNSFTGNNTYANGYITINNDNGLTIRSNQGTILQTDISGSAIKYHGSELATKDDIKNAGSSSSIDEQSLMILLCGGSNIRTGTDKAEWVIKGTTAYYIYIDEDITSSDKAATCDLTSYKILKTVCEDGRIIIYYPNTNIPDDGVGLLIKY